MPDLRHRLENAPEHLDEANHDDAVLQHSLAHVAQVNRFLGGYSALLRSLLPVLRQAPAHRRSTQDSGGANETARILDIGTASADIPLVVLQAARAAGVQVEILATDIHPQMRAIAKARTAAHPEIRIDAADALALPYPDASFDVALLSMTLHHFEGDAPVRALAEAARVARVVIVNELARNRLNYTGAQLLSHTWWRRNRLTRHDGPISVLRAFTPDELRALALAANLRVLELRRAWFNRIVMVAAR